MAPDGNAPLCDNVRQLATQAERDTLINRHGGAQVQAVTCGEAMMKLLAAYEVDTVFGMAGTMTLELYRGITRSPCS